LLSLSPQLIASLSENFINFNTTRIRVHNKIKVWREFLPTVNKLISELEEGKQIDTASVSLKIHEGLTRKLGLETEGDAPATAQIRAEVEGLAQGQAEPMTLRSSFGTIDVLWQRARGAIWWDPAPAPVPAPQHIEQ
jgi:hypothetical protein